MPAPFPEEKVAVLCALLFSRRKEEAIELYRELAGCSAREAKRRVARLESALRKDSPEKFPAAVPGRGCLGLVATFCLCIVAAITWITCR